MTSLLLGLIVFIGLHQLPGLPTLRGFLVQKLGEGGYKGAFSLTALAGLGLIVYGKSVARFVHVYTPLEDLRIATTLLVLAAFVLFPASIVPCNLRRLVRHPQLIAVALWALGHLLVNGDLASVLLFGGFLGFAVNGIVSANRRAKVPGLDSKPLVADFAAVIIGLVAWAALSWFHDQLFGVPALIIN
ncbi:MAG: NnrU family protein [Arenicellales bacterium]|jgi:uncharacterized membrane protein|nr:NnrU family protein [Arenicellales bacterium]MDP6854035.1 NnrU family protein [Arenicellales bacterium]